MDFNKEYTKYWRSSTLSSIDGLKIPGELEAAHILSFVNINQDDKILDLGCSYGRMFKVLNSFSKNIYGIEPDLYAIDEALINNYITIKRGKAEQIDFNSGFFDFVFSWQVFDVVDQLNSLVEINRVLKVGGSILFTGKNYNYLEEDNFAFTAEKNAFLKKFPNKFTDLDVLIKNIDKLGFKILKLLIFSKRGDFGSLLYSIEDLNKKKIKGYEYVLVCEKISNIIIKPDILIDRTTSITAERIAKARGCLSAEELFKTIGID
jgi:SAM-dependent methyltransferase